ncbi:hypothetical protein BDV93DRAFT_514819, partial [Ceratobasidium sp. AG-I]
MNKLDTYNKALQAEWKEFQVTSPEEVQELEAAAKAIRDNTLGNIGDQPPAMQKRMLDGLPSEIARTLDQWGKIYNMVSYIVCIWEDTESKTQAFDYASLRARSYLNTKGAKEQRVSFEGWVTKNVGRLLSQQEHGTSLQIFPDINGMPQLPVIQGPCSARIKAQLLRRYFIAKYESQGGLEITWKRFEKESIDDISRTVEITRMPADITHLVDPARMSVNDMDKWIAHIHKGQKSDAEPHSIFQFHITSAGPHEQPIVHTTLQTVPHPSSRLRYTPAERNFAKQYKPEEVSPSARMSELSQWSGLPLARTVAHFQAIEPFVLRDLDSWGGVYAHLSDMMRDIALMEIHGPAHQMVISASMDEIGRNPHLMAAASVENWVTHKDSHWLPLKFIDQAHPKHYDWSLLSLLYCVRNIQPHRHLDSETVLGGPYGVRVLGYGIRRVALNLRGILMRESVPDPISAAMRRTSSGWNTNTALELLGQCVAAIRSDIEQSNTILIHSFPERSRAWVDELNKLNEEYEAQKSSSSDFAQTSTDEITCGLPRSLQDAHSMWLMLPDSQHTSVTAVPAVLA